MLFGGETAESYYEEGLTAYMKGEFAQAIRFFERAYELNANLHIAHYQIGRCLLRQGKADAALSKFTRTARMLSNHVPLKLDTGFALLQLRRTQEARSTFASILEEHPEEPRAILGLAYCAFTNEQWDVVVNLLMPIVEQGRAQFDTHYLMARAADKLDLPGLSTEHYQQAAHLAEKCAEASPSHPAGYYLKALISSQMGNYATALQDIEKALEYAEAEQVYSAYTEVFTKEDIGALKKSIEANAVERAPTGNLSEP